MRKTAVSQIIGIWTPLDTILNYILSDEDPAAEIRSREALKLLGSL